MICPHCRSEATTQRRQRSALGYRRFSCRSCHRRYNERTGTPFNDLQFPTDIGVLDRTWNLPYCAPVLSRIGGPKNTPVGAAPAGAIVQQLALIS